MLRLYTLLYLFLITFNVLADSKFSSQIHIDISPEKAKCIGFKVKEPSDLSFMEIEYPASIETNLTPYSISVGYYKKGKLLFTNFTSLEKHTNKNSVFVVFNENLKENDASVSIGYKQADKKPRLYKIGSVKALYHSKSNIACN